MLKFVALISEPGLKPSGSYEQAAYVNLDLIGSVVEVAAPTDADPYRYVLRLQDRTGGTIGFTLENLFREAAMMPLLGHVIEELKRLRQVLEVMGEDVERMERYMTQERAP